MPVPDYETLMRPVLQAFAEGAQNVAEIVPLIVAQFHITPEEAEEQIPSGRVTIVSSRTHWARTYLSKAGALTSPKRNHHVITDLGRRLLAENPTRIDNSVLARVEGFDTWRRPLKDSGEEGPIDAAATNAQRADGPVQTPEDALDGLAAQMDAVLAHDLIDAVAGLTPLRFEQLIVDLLLAMGYGGGASDMGRRLGKSGDGGIDGVINEDPLGLDAVYVQAKRYAPENIVGRPALQAFVGSLTGEGASKGVFVTTSSFSKGAREYVDRVAHRIVLIDGDRLARLMIAHGVGVRTRKTYAIQGVDEDYFAET